MGFDDDDFFAGGGGGFGNQDAFAYNDGGSEPQMQQPRSQIRPTRQRRASLGVTSGPIMSLSAPIVPSKPMRTKSSDNFAAPASSNSTRTGSRRPTSASTEVSLNGRLEAVPGRVSGSGSNRGAGGSGDRSVTSNGSNSNSQRRSGRRASMASGAPSSRNIMPQQQQQPQYRSTNHNINEDADYGYGYDDQPQYNNNNYNHHEVEDMGYGDQIEEEGGYSQPVPQEEPVRARRQRRCSIADVVNTASVQPTPNDYGYGTSESFGNSNSAEESRGGSQHPRLGAVGNASISNMAIPMTLSDEPKRTNRRGSIAMLGNIGRTKAPKEAEPSAKKPAADRDRQRQRQGNLLDRVGASTSNDGRGTSRAGTTSYSDRILSK